MFFLILKLLDVCSKGTDQLGRSEEGDISDYSSMGFQIICSSSLLVYFSQSRLQLEYMI